jgi:hypothetical protein
MLSVRRLAAAGAKLEVDPRMTESSDTSDTPAKPQDYAGLRAELAMLVDDFSPVIDDLWPRLHPWHHPELNDHWTETFNSDLAGGLPRA